MTLLCITHRHPGTTHTRKIDKIPQKLPLQDKKYHKTYWLKGKIYGLIGVSACACACWTCDSARVKYLLVGGKRDKNMVEHEHFNQQRAVQYNAEYIINGY